VTSPILFIRGMRDESVPNYHSVKLYEKAKSSAFKSMYVCHEGDHNSTWKIGGEEYIKAFKEFFEKCEKI
jgi:predicted esterase